MQESSWEDGRVVLSARGSGSGGHSVTPGGGQGGSATAAAASRTQDDARVGYFFQRPQAGGVHQPYDPALLKAWAATDGEASSFHGQVGNLCGVNKHSTGPTGIHRDPPEPTGTRQTPQRSPPDPSEPSTAEFFNL